MSARISRLISTCLAAVAALALGASAGMAQAPVRIGIALSQTGSLADSAEHYRKSVALWQEQANARGGILGRQVELVMYDDRSDPGTAVKLYERLITVDKVDLLLGPFGSASTSAASPVAEKHKMVMMNGGGAARTIHARGFRHLFQTVSPPDTYVEGVFPLAAKAGFKTIALTSKDYPAGRDLEKSIRTLSAASGLKLLEVAYYPAGTTDYASHIARARELKPDIWVINGSPNEAIEMVRQMKAMNYMPKMFVSNGAAQEDFISAVGKDGEYVVGMSLYEPMLKTKDNAAFVAAFKAKWGYEPGYYAAMGWAMATVLEEAVRKAGAIDQAKLAAVLRELRTETPFGPYAVDETGLQIAKKGLIVQIRNGVREIIWPDEVASVQPVLSAPGWQERR
ncbi:MAG: amino acid ABC transporter substrate-binding protein [Alphaproteobacteria bacterium]